ncbi:MAG: NADH-ubiquinone oxidoreductase-F iron-sulfur binding region domain-containing protein, partial [Clostridium sp.]
GTFKDRSLLEFDPFRVLEGIAMAAFTVDADKAFIYMREEYGKLQKRMNRAIAAATEAGYLGENYLGSGRNLTVKVVSGAGAYVCGEGSAIAESIEGKIGRPRPKPPYIKQCGVFSLPTLVNNVETLSILPLLFSEDADAYVNSGTEESKGTKIISISGNVNNPGVYEIPFGLTLREIIFHIGGGIRGGKAFKFTQLGGASGPIAPESLLDTKYTYEDLSAVGLSIGSGAVMVADETNSIIDYMETVQDFFAHESCGKCTPCREGTLQLQNIMKRFVNSTASETDLELCSKLSNVMKVASFCGLGKSCMAPLLSSLEYFKEEFTERIV